MKQPQLNFVACKHADGEHRMAYWEWASAAGPAAPVALCVHGLTRQGRDFDHLARELSATHRVICPDVVGRGESDWLANPSQYQVPTYAADIVALLAHLSVPQVVWVGTSMGGLIGMVLAAMQPGVVTRLVLNDVGPTIEADSIRRMAASVGVDMTFDSIDAAADHVWRLSQGFGPHSREDWLDLTRPLLRSLPEGGWRLRYDPAIGDSLRSLTAETAAAGEALLWQCYEAIQAPTLLLRGESSDVLSATTAAKMGACGPRAALLTWPGIGHAPTLVDPDQVRAVAAFVRGAAPANV